MQSQQTPIDDSQKLTTTQLRNLLNAGLGLDGRTGEKVTAKQLYKLLESQHFKCALTGDAMTPESASLDHINPLSSGGSNEISNLQWLNKEVNAAKGTMSQEQFIAMCRKVAAAWPEDRN